MNRVESSRNRINDGGNGSSSIYSSSRNNSSPPVYNSENQGDVGATSLASRASSDTGSRRGADSVSMDGTSPPPHTPTRQVGHVNSHMSIRGSRDRAHSSGDRSFPRKALSPLSSTAAAAAAVGLPLVGLFSTSPTGRSGSRSGSSDAGGGKDPLVLCTIMGVVCLQFSCGGFPLSRIHFLHFTLSIVSLW